MTDHADIYLSKRQVAEMLGARWWKIDRLRRDADAKFPEPYWISQSSPRWSRAEIVEWMRARILDPRRGA
ncbi:MAG: hypothetical protein JO105_22760 [Hyphomicrobiales bacterium]|nr:hypothetical protein [Hyphomicrobiales bacterium]